MNSSMAKAGGAEMRMSEGEWTRIAGWAGIAAVLLYFVGFGLYLAAGQPPDFTAAAEFTAYVHDHSALIIGAALVFGLDFAMLLVWFAGFAT